MFPFPLLLLGGGTGDFLRPLVLRDMQYGSVEVLSRGVMLSDRFVSNTHLFTNAYGGVGSSNGCPFKMSDGVDSRVDMDGVMFMGTILMGVAFFFEKLPKISSWAPRPLNGIDSVKGALSPESSVL